MVTPACGAGSDPTPPPRAVLAYQRGSKSRRPGCSGNGGASGGLARGRRGDLGPERAGGLPRLRPSMGLPAGDQSAQLLQRHGRGWAGDGRRGRAAGQGGTLPSPARRPPVRAERRFPWENRPLRTRSASPGTQPSCRATAEPRGRAARELSAGRGRRAPSLAEAAQVERVTCLSSGA